MNDTSKQSVKQKTRSRQAFGVFLCYHGTDTAQIAFARAVYRYLRRAPGLIPYIYSEYADSGRFPVACGKMLKACNALVLLADSTLGKWQRHELEHFELSHPKGHRLWVQLNEKSPRDDTFRDFVAKLHPITLAADRAENLLHSAYECASQIAKRLNSGLPKSDNEKVVPENYPYEYEKTIIDELLTDARKSPIRKYLPGWPAVKKAQVPIQDKWDNKLPKQSRGDFKDEKSLVIVDARAAKLRPAMSLPEAGARPKLVFPLRQNAEELHVGIIVSGGIAPGINAVIDGIVDRHYLYRTHSDNPKMTLHVLGFTEGFKGLLAGANNAVTLTPELTGTFRHDGGSRIGTSRCPDLMDPDPQIRRAKLDSVIDSLEKKNVDILYVIGGDGSMRAAHALATRAIERRSKHSDARLHSVVGIPKTMDNDILWVWQAFGFLSAVEKAREVISNLKTEVSSNPRVSIIQLFGSDSGFVVAHAALASGCCDYALIPEVEFSVKQLASRVCTVLSERKRNVGTGLPYFLIVMAETAIPNDVEDYLDTSGLTDKEREAIKRFAHLKPFDKEPGDARRVRGQTPDELRTGGLKIVARELERKIHQIPGFGDYFGSFRVLTNEPRHLLRSVPPSATDVIFGERLGALAVDGAMAGYTDFMISQWLTEYVLVPLALVVLGRKRVPRNGIFWKSVLARTKQED